MKKIEKNKKSQISTELIIIFSVLLILALYVMVSVDKKQDLFYSETLKIQARGITEKTALNINQAILGGAGTKIIMQLPDRINENTNYTLKTLPARRLIEISWKSNKDNSINTYSSFITTTNIESYTFKPGTVNITNEDGYITLT